MSSKSVPKIPETRVQLVTKLENKRVRRFCRHYGFMLFIGILFIIVLSYCFFLHVSMKELQMHVAKFELLDQPTTLAKRHLNLEDRRLKIQRHKRRRRHDVLGDLKRKIKDLQELPLVHLQGKPTLTTTENRRGCSYSQPCFVWQFPEHHYPNEFVYVMDNGVVGVNITRAGYYYVYSQMSVHGLKNEYNIPAFPAFGYETIKVTGTREPVVLVKSFVTQDQRGQSYSTVNGNGINPLNTMNQMGIFRLNCGETIMVRSAGQLHNIKFLQDPHQTYFGLALLRPKALNDFSCY